MEKVSHSTCELSVVDDTLDPSNFSTNVMTISTLVFFFFERVSTLVLFNQNCSTVFKLATKTIIKLPASSCTLFKQQKCLD